MKKLTIACTLGLLATVPALAADDMTATAEIFTRALLQHDGTQAAALVALPADGKISREQLAQCIGAQSRKYMPNGGEVLGSEAQSENNVLVRTRVNGIEGGGNLSMTKTSDGWRLDSSIITDMECDAASILSGTELGTVATAYLRSRDGVSYDSVRIDNIEYHDGGKRADVYLSGEKHAVVPNPPQVKYRYRLPLEKVGGKWQVIDNGCALACFVELPVDDENAGGNGDNDIARKPRQ